MTKFVTVTLLSLLVLCELLLPVVSLKISSVPRFLLKHPNNFYTVLRKLFICLQLIICLLQFLTETANFIITFIHSVGMHIKNSNVTLVFCWYCKYIWHPITNKLIPAGLIPLCMKKPCSWFMMFILFSVANAVILI